MVIFQIVMNNSVLRNLFRSNRTQRSTQIMQRRFQGKILDEKKLTILDKVGGSPSVNLIYKNYCLNFS